MMPQYEAIRSQHPGKVVVWRIGDFDEVFGPDAERIATALHFTLTTRQTGEDVYAMCGYPVCLRHKYLTELRCQKMAFVVCERDADGHRIIVDIYDGATGGNL